MQNKEISLASDFVELINRQASAAVMEIIRTGELLIEAKGKLAHGLFERMFEDHPNRMPKYIRMSSRYGRTFMSIASSRAIKNNFANLGPNIKVLAELSKLSEDKANELISSGEITKTTSVSGAKAAIAKRNPSSDFKMPKNSHEPNRNPTETKSEPVTVSHQNLGLPQSILDGIDNLRDLLTKSYARHHDGNSICNIYDEDGNYNEKAAEDAWDESDKLRENAIDLCLKLLACDFDCSEGKGVESDWMEEIEERARMANQIATLPRMEANSSQVAQ